MMIFRILMATLLTFNLSASYALTAQQEKMKTCNADAKTKALKGDERKAFMKDCLSKKPAMPATEPAPTAAPSATPPAPAPAAAPASAPAAK